MPDFNSASQVMIFWAVAGYFLGSIPFGLLFSRLFGLADPRTVGSHNIGATNVLRSGSKPAAALTLIADALKAVVAVLAARFAAGEDAAQLAALAAFIGHCYPIWLNFRGGKGVATFLGIMLALSWPVGLACCATWLAAAAATRYSSMGALTAGACSTIWIVVLDQGEIFFLGVILTLLLFWRHSANIGRLRAGTEPRIGAKKA